MIVSLRKIWVIKVEMIAIKMGVEQSQHAWIGDGGEGRAEVGVLRRLGGLVGLLHLLLGLLETRWAEDGRWGGGRRLQWRRWERRGGQVGKKFCRVGRHLESENTWNTSFCILARQYLTHRALAGVCHLNLASGRDLVLHVGAGLLPAVLLHLCKKASDHGPVKMSLYTGRNILGWKEQTSYSPISISFTTLMVQWQPCRIISKLKVVGCCCKKEKKTHA